MGKIKILPDEIVRKIAAGEVIERPASCVKELLENSLDAGASRIEIEVEEGGKRLIRVADSGEGMTPEDLALSLQSHATSKLAKLEDLYSIRTLGFRGEALNSIAAVAEVRIVSRTKGSAQGAKVEAAGSKFAEPVPIGAPEGTSVEVRSLFFNTPARRKFLKSPGAEMAQITDVATRIALAHEGVHFSLHHNRRKVFLLPPARDLHERVGALFGEELAQGLLSFSEEEGPISIQGLASLPSVTRANSRMQFTFLNGRYIRDRLLLHAIARAYEGLVEPRRYAIVFLFLEMPPQEVDVNVHPTKREVRFRNNEQIFRAVLSALERGLASGLPPSLEAPRPGRQTPEDIARRKKEIAESIAEYFRLRGTMPQGRLSWESFARGARGKGRGLPEQKGGPPWPATAPERGRPSLAAQAALQIHNTYLVEETPEGLSITDQHALHERILFQEISDRLKNRPLESQRLLIPETIPAGPADFDKLEAAKETVVKFGLEMDRFGAGAIAIYAFPALLVKADVALFARDFLDKLEAPGQGASETIEEKLDELIALLACRAAIKAQEALSPEEIESLLARRQGLDKRYLCPHGRPTTLTFTLKELERQFKRR